MGLTLALTDFDHTRVMTTFQAVSDFFDTSTVERPWASYVVITGGVLLTWKLLVSSIHGWRRRQSMPPGPPGIPFLGNLLQIGKKPLRLQLTDWKEQYGAIFSLNLAGSPVVVLNSPEVTSDLLERRADIYSDRPPSIMGGQLITGGQFLLFTPYGPLYTRLRRAAQEGLTPKISRTYCSMQAREASFLVLNILAEPKTWQQEFKRTILSFTSSIIYGWQPIPSIHDPFINKLRHAIEKIELAAVPGSYLIDVFPWLLYLPRWMSVWKQQGAYYYEKNTEIFEGLMEEVRQKRDTIVKCFALGMWDKIDSGDLTRTEAAWTTGTVLGGGSATSPELLSVFVLAMGFYPDIMRRAQAEIDAVVGRDRMPTFDDWDQLPYVHAIVKECLRWKTVTPLGVPHRCMEDNWYRGYFIPKGTIIIANIWGMHHDSSLYPDAERFYPERFLDDTGKLKTFTAATHSQGHFTFGFGKRICPGLHVANQMLWISVASMLWAFDIDKIVELDGSPLRSTEDAFVDNGILLMPTFNASFTPRSENIDAIVELEYSKRMRE